MIITIYHILGIIVSVCIIGGIVIKFVSNNLKKSWKADIEFALNQQKKAFAEKIKEEINLKYDSLEKDIARTNKSIDEIKDLLKAQQETLISIQLGITEMGPKVKNLENRVDKIEERLNRSHE